jgi:hypothetical protein
MAQWLVLLLVARPDNLAGHQLPAAGTQAEASQSGDVEKGGSRQVGDAGSRDTDGLLSMAMQAPSLAGVSGSDAGAAGD